MIPNTDRSGIEIVGEQWSGTEEILTPDALHFVASLQRQFNAVRKDLLQQREERQAALAEGGTLGFLSEAREIRESEWTVAPAPADLNDRRVEITGPCDRKMMINALNSGAKVFMADLEDALSPTWRNIIEGQRNLRDAVRRTISFESPDGRRYELNDQVATLVVRPRGWHLEEPRVLIDGLPASASLFDFGLTFFHNAHELIARGSGPYFYLPKLESYREARLWNDVFNAAQDALGIPRGTIRATVLIETLPAALQMDEILYELHEHAAGLNAGRWDYIFSAIKILRDRDDVILPDRDQVTMTVPFMRAYCLQLVKTCHRRGAHAIGGMAAFIPSRRDPAVNAVALQKVREDKEREAGDGFDGTWVAHPDLVPTALEVFDRALGERPNQKDRPRDDVNVTDAEILAVGVPGSTITDGGVRGNVSVALQYLNSWLLGNGAVAINNLMEDAATAEIARAQLWQWIRHGAATVEGNEITEASVSALIEDEVARLSANDPGRYQDAAAILKLLIKPQRFISFLTLPAMAYLN